MTNDTFEDYFFHKLKSWIPENYWTDDFGNGSLEVLIRVIAEGAAVNFLISGRLPMINYWLPHLAVSSWVRVSAFL
jgi:hypothetical protein